MSTTSKAPPAQAPSPSTGEPAYRVNKVVFTASVIGVLVVAIWAMVSSAQAETAIGSAVGWTTTWFGWFYVLLSTLVLVYVLYLALSRFGHVKLGPDHSQPEYSMFSWAAMLFAAGIGTDLMFFSVAEPVTQYLAPPVGEGGTVEAAREATVWTLFHYGITGWAMYALMGIALGYFAYRLHRPLAVRSALYPIFGKRMDGGLGHAVDTAAVLGTVFGVATSLGIGVVQLNFGLELMFGIKESLGAQIGLIVLAVVMAAISATTGVDKGIRLLSQLNVLLAIGLAGWILVTGKTSFLLNSLVMNVGDFVRGFPGMTMETFAYTDSAEWMGAWTLFFWAWWIAWASFVGLFLARISRGRTIRQFVLGAMIIPFSYIVMWVSIFGNSAIEQIRSGDSAFGELAMDVPQQGYYTLLQQYPGATFLVGLSTVVGLLFYVTSADSGALVMANLSSRLRTVHDDAGAPLRIVWAVVTGLLTIAMLSVDGIFALQNATVIMGLPFAFVMFLVMLGLWRALQLEGMRVDSGHRALPMMISARGGDGADARTWRGRLSRALSFVDDEGAQEYLAEVVEPALSEVAVELNERGVQAEVVRNSPGGDVEPDSAPPTNVVLEASPDDIHPFRYCVEIDSAPVPVYGGRMARDRDTYARLEVHSSDGSLGYDVMGYSQGQIIQDCLDQYERHLEFLRLEHRSGL